MTTTGIDSSIEGAYRSKFAGSHALWQRAIKVTPSGINHDLRRITPFPVYVDHALGCRKWDVDGNELLDLGTGHGSLILGHGHPAIVRAVQEQVAKVTHPSAPTPLEVQWAENITRLVPCAEMTRFVLSGTEATMLAMRLARAHTMRDVIVRIRGHFHGWHDYAMVGYVAPYYLPGSNGVPNAVSSTMRIVPLHDLAAMEEALEPRDVAAVILEADGPLGGTVPVQPGFLEGVRELTERYGTLLHLRRGRDRLPDDPRWRAAVLRDHAGPRDIREGRLRRHSWRCPRRQGRGHVGHRVPRRPRVEPSPAGAPQWDVQRQPDHRGCGCGCDDSACRRLGAGPLRRHGRSPQGGHERRHWPTPASMGAPSERARHCASSPATTCPLSTTPPNSPRSFRRNACSTVPCSRF